MTKCGTTRANITRISNKRNRQTTPTRKTSKFRDIQLYTSPSAKPPRTHDPLTRLPCIESVDRPTITLQRSLPAITSFDSVNFAVLKFLTLAEDHREAHQGDNKCKSCVLCGNPNFWETIDEEHR